MTRSAVLCIGFNRPDLFGQVLDAIGQDGPRELFVSIDGPRADRAGDAALSKQVYAVARAATWPTDVHFKVERENLGCGRATTSAVSWALEHVEQIIVFDDDCLPDPSFLRFCDELLDRYRDDERVMQIAATNWGASPSRFDGCSYGFVSFAPVWGWATWRRAWALNDFELRSWSRLKQTGLVNGMAIEPRFRRLLERDWEQVLAGHGTWDHQWQYSVLRHHGLSIVPERNLVVNIGFRSDGTQLRAPDLFFGSLPLESVQFPLRHPPEVARNPAVEAVFGRVYWQKHGWPGRLFRRLIRNAELNRVIRIAARRVLPRPS